MYVHRKTLAIVLLKYSMKAESFSRRLAVEVKFPRLSTRRPRMLNQISTWFSQDACRGVYEYERHVAANLERRINGSVAGSTERLLQKGASGHRRSEA